MVGVMRKAKSILIESFEELERSSSSKIKVKLESLKNSLDSRANVTEAALEAAYEAANKEMQSKFQRMSAKVGTGELDDIIPAKIGEIDRISFVITKMRFDFKAGKYDPEYILISRGSEENLLSIQNTLMDIDRFMLIPQNRFEGKNLLEYLMSKSCSLVENAKYKCSYHECDVKLVNRKVQYLLDAQEIGYEWMKILTIFTCQKQSSTRADKNDCLTGTLVESIEAEKKKILSSQKETWSLLMRQNTDQKETCDCQLGEYKSFQSNGTEIECLKCPLGTYNLVIGAHTCERCPEILSKTEASFRQCLNSEFLRLGERIKAQVSKQRQSESLMSKLKAEIQKSERGEKLFASSSSKTNGCSPRIIKK